MSKPHVFIGSDHAGRALRQALVHAVAQWGYVVHEVGPHADVATDYPACAADVCRSVLSHQDARGIVLCGSGIGMSIAANRHEGIRCALVHEPYSARLAREHNDANVLALGARMIGTHMAEEIVHVWLTTPFSGDARHMRRIMDIEVHCGAHHQDGRRCE